MSHQGPVAVASNLMDCLPWASLHGPRPLWGSQSQLGLGSLPWVVWMPSYPTNPLLYPNRCPHLLPPLSDQGSFGVSSRDKEELEMAFLSALLAPISRVSHIPILQFEDVLEILTSPNDDAEVHVVAPETTIDTKVPRFLVVPILHTLTTPWGCPQAIPCSLTSARKGFPYLPLPSADCPSLRLFHRQP